MTYENPVTWIDVDRGTRDDLIALWKHCLRMIGKDDHIFEEQTRDNEWLIGGPENFLKTVDDYIEKRGAKCDKRNVKRTTHLAFGLSPEYFREGYHREDPDGFGKYDPERLKEFKMAAKQWLDDTFGDDCVAAHLHVDERTPHIHAVIVPTYQKKARVPQKPRRRESIEEFEVRKAEAAKKPGRVVVSHHKHDLFGAGKFSYEKVVDSYHAAVEHLGIERPQRGKGATPTTKEQWVRNLVQKAQKMHAEAAENVRSQRERQRLEDKSFEFGSQCVIDEKIRYRAASEKHNEGLVSGPKWPEKEVEREEIKVEIQPAKKRITEFAKMVAEFAAASIEKAHAKAIAWAKNLTKKEAELAAKEAELKERERSLGILEDMDAVELDDGKMADQDDRKLRDAGVVRDQREAERVLEPQLQRTSGQRVR